MDLTEQEEKVSAEAVAYVKANKRQLIDTYANEEQAPPQARPTAVFMAGSPGAGKTEFARSFIEVVNHQQPYIACIDPDEIRMSLPGYEGGNAYVLQKAVTRAVDEIFSALIKRKQSFLLDGTLSNFDKAKQNIERALKRKYSVEILYVYQDPESAWKFTQAREKQEGRRIELNTFVEQYFSAKDTVNALKQEFGDQVGVTLVIKDAYHNIKKYRRNIQSIDPYLKMKYDAETLRAFLSS